MITAKLRAWWQKIRKPLGIIGIIMACTGVVVLVFIEVRLYGTGFTGKTLWDWLGLLAALAIPVVVGIGAAWLTTQQAKVSDRENKDNQREAALQAYIDKISELLLHEKLRDSSENGEVRNIARVRTITILVQLDARRIGYVFAFLREAGLMSMTSNDNVVSLRQADLHTVNWSQANLSGANLSEANLSGADLSEANLSEADLSRAELSGANLRGADLHGASLYRAKLSEADLRGVNLFGVDLSGAFLNSAKLNGARLGAIDVWEDDSSFGGANLSNTYLHGANLYGASLYRANLSEANLSKANLKRADFSEANLSRANLKDTTGITVAELEKQAKSLEGATMPDGSKHP